ncbi:MULTISPECIES: hypothetical protein [Microbacterium]|uniref:hypothetical protein n=1 Tax=Microbacterium TaxID=33882 RepID=UPI002789890A|nr:MULTISPECIES: hypothetical protein [Microbacterium]MDQ1085399.1 hypothetical protein [Microbacterium sp. SORGH_AS_0344]MDQ1169295.1 hypothetical protein [Microbacterium proteolyticum]
MSTNDDPVLSEAVTAYLGWPKAHMPSEDESAVARVGQNASGGASELLARVEGAIADSDHLPTADLNDHPDGGAAAYKSRLKHARSDLSDAAVDALASRWFFRLRWLGIQSGSDAPRYFVRYGGEGASPIPISLFRRRTVEGGHVDEFLKNVGDWRTDIDGKIQYALIFSLDSDLEEVTADEAAQFEAMVRNGNYVPFRSAH